MRDILGRDPVSERRACQVLGQSRSTQRRAAHVPDGEPVLVRRMVELATQYGRYGYRRVTALLRAEGFAVNHKRVERLWREGLKVPARQPKRRRLWRNDGSCVRLRPEYARTSARRLSGSARTLVRSYETDRDEPEPSEPGNTRVRPTPLHSHRADVVTPILFIVGPSGVGKTTLAEYMAGHAGFLHVNFDRADGRTGVDVEGLRGEWTAFLDRRDPRPLADAVRGKVRAAGKCWAVITCPSGIAPSGDPGETGCGLSRDYLVEMGQAGMRCVVLWGSLDECMDSFLSRADGQTYGVKYWWDNNPRWFPGFRPEDFGEHVVSVFGVVGGGPWTCWQRKCGAGSPSEAEDHRRCVGSGRAVS